MSRYSLVDHLNMHFLSCPLTHHFNLIIQRNEIKTQNKGKGKRPVFKTSVKIEEKDVSIHDYIYSHGGSRHDRPGNLQVSSNLKKIHHQYRKTKGTYKKKKLKLNILDMLHQSKGRMLYYIKDEEAYYEVHDDEAINRFTKALNKITMDKKKSESAELSRKCLNPE